MGLKMFFTNVHNGFEKTEIIARNTGPGTGVSPIYRH